MSDNTNPQVASLVAAKAATSYYKAKATLKIVSIVLAVILGMSVAMFVAAYVATEARTFPIYINNTGGIIISEDKDFSDPVSKLNVIVPEAMTNISGSEIPEDVNDEDYVGAHNGNDYIAYTFFLKSTMEDKTQQLNEKVLITLNTQNAGSAIRFRLYRNGELTTYAQVSASGTPEHGTTPFVDEDTVCDNTITLEPNEKIQYTIVVWLEGDDPECIDDIMGGYVGFKVEFEATAED